MMKEIVKLSLQKYFCSGQFCMCFTFIGYLLLTCFQILNFVWLVTVDVLIGGDCKSTVFWDVMPHSLVEVYHYTASHPRTQDSSVPNLISLCHINRCKGKFAPALKSCTIKNRWHGCKTPGIAKIGTEWRWSYPFFFFRFLS
jgi:hypothetical protein